MDKLYFIYSDKDFKHLLPIFGTAEFLIAKSKEYGWISDGNFLLAYYIDRRFIFSKLVFTTNVIAIEDSFSLSDVFWKRVIEKCRELKVDYIAQPLANVFFDTFPSNAKYAEWGSYVVSLKESEDQLLKAMNSKNRNVIKKAISDGVSIKKTNDCLLIYKIIKETMERQKRQYPALSSIEAIKNISSFYIAEKDDKVQGCAVIAYNKLGAYYLYGGSIVSPYSGSLNYMHYFIMLDLKGMGVKLYDFMGARLSVEKGSKLEGIQRFKSRFGGVLYTGYVWKYEYRPIKMILMKLSYIVIFFLKWKKYNGDAIDQEIKKSERLYSNV